MKKIKQQVSVLLLVLTLFVPQVFQPLQIFAQSTENSGEFLIEEAVEFGDDSVDSEDTTVEESDSVDPETAEATTTEEQSQSEEETTTESAEDSAEIATDDFIPLWLNQLMEDKSQNNSMLVEAYQDYQQIEEKFTYLDIVELGEGSTYEFVQENFTYTHPNVEVIEETSEIGLSVLTFLYQVEEGDLNPERDLEDWAMVEFYFVTDILIYSSLSSMSLGFNENNSVTLEGVDEWVDQSAEVESLAQENNFELNAFGQVLANGEFIYGLGMPVVEGEDFQGGLLAVQDGRIFAANSVAIADIEAVSFSAVLYVLMLQITPNNVFMPAEEELPADEDAALVPNESLGEENLQLEENFGETLEENQDQFE